VLPISPANWKNFILTIPINSNQFRKREHATKSVLRGGDAEKKTGSLFGLDTRAGRGY
jgi:hypothetical protein